MDITNGDQNQIKTLISRFCLKGKKKISSFNENFQRRFNPVKIHMD